MVELTVDDGSGAADTVVSVSENWASDGSKRGFSECLAIAMGSVMCGIHASGHVLVERAKDIVEAFSDGMEWLHEEDAKDEQL